MASRAVCPYVSTLLEQHYTVGKLANLWGLDTSTVRNMFRKRAGILVIAHPKTRAKRSYVSLRIPASVAQIVYVETMSR